MPTNFLIIIIYAEDLKRKWLPANRPSLFLKEEVSLFLLSEFIFLFLVFLGYINIQKTCQKVCA